MLVLVLKIQLILFISYSIFHAGPEGSVRNDVLVSTAAVLSDEEDASMDHEVLEAVPPDETCANDPSAGPSLTSLAVDVVKESAG